jgi:hypothetical protein
MRVLYTTFIVKVIRISSLLLGRVKATILKYIYDVNMIKLNDSIGL